MAIKDSMNNLSITFIVKLRILDIYFTILCSKCLEEILSFSGQDFILC